MDYKKKQEELTKTFENNQALITNHTNEIKRIALLQEQIRGQFALLIELDKPKEDKKK